MIVNKYNTGGGGSGSTVVWNQTLSAGTEIAKITINGTQQNVYAPEGGGVGTSDYNNLQNKPQIGGVTLSGDTSLDTIGAVSKNMLQAGDIATITGTSEGSLVYNTVTAITLGDAWENDIKYLGGKFITAQADIPTELIEERTKIFDGKIYKETMPTSYNPMRIFIISGDTDVELEFWLGTSTSASTTFSELVDGQMYELDIVSNLNYRMKYFALKTGTKYQVGGYVSPYSYFSINTGYTAYDFDYAREGYYYKDTDYKPMGLVAGTHIKIVDGIISAENSVNVTGSTGVSVSTGGTISLNLSGGTGIAISNNGTAKVISVKNTVVQSNDINNIWKGTQAEYDALGTYDNNTFYIII